MKILSTIYFEDKKFGLITINRMNRKTLSLSINPENSQITVKAPKLMVAKDIERFILGSYNWLERHLREINKRPVTNHTYRNGDEFYYLGKKYPLEIGESLLFRGDAFCVNSSDVEIIKSQLQFIYRVLAQDYIIEETERVAKHLGFTFKEVKIGNAKKRFGVCNNRGKITFSWQLIMFPVEVINYVIIHELTHLIEFNHSKKFWDKVAEFLPDYQKQRKFLKDNALIIKAF